MPDYEVEVDAVPEVYPPDADEDQCDALRTHFALLVTAATARDAFEQAADHLFEHVIEGEGIIIDPDETRELEPGEAPLAEDYTNSPFDLRENKTPFTRHNRFFDQPPPPPPPGMEHLANASHEEMLEELRHSLAQERAAKLREGGGLRLVGDRLLEGNHRNRKLN